VASMPVMNLFLRAIFTVEAVFSYVILGQYFAEELRAIRPTHCCRINLICRIAQISSRRAVKKTTPIR
jgi:hypothetical protein